MIVYDEDGWPQGWKIKIPGRAAVISGFLKHRAYIAVSIAVFAWKLHERSAPIAVRVWDLPREVVPDVESALAFYRLEAPYDLDWSKP